MISSQRLLRKRHHYLRWATLIIGVLLVLDLITFLLAERQWFEELGYLQVFTMRLRVQGGVGIFAFLSSVGFLLSHIVLARQHAWKNLPTERDRPVSLRNRISSGNPVSSSTEPRPLLPGNMRLGVLLPLTLSMSLIIGIMLIYHGQIAVSHWHPNFSLYNTQNPSLPLKFRLESILQIGRQMVTPPPLNTIPGDNVTQWMVHVARFLMTPILQLGLFVTLSIAILILPQFVLSAIAVVMSFSFGLVLSEHWANILPYFFPTAFNLADPLVQQDIGFYIFRLPVWELLQFWLVGLFILTFLSVALIYLLSGKSLSQGQFPGFSAAQQRHLYGLSSAIMLMVGLNYWLNRYTLMYSKQGVSYGASYTNVVIQLPVYTGLSIAALLIALLLLWRTIAWQRKLPLPFQLSLPNLIVLYFLIALITTVLIPAGTQRLIVQPNELELERPFMERTIALTRQAFDLEKIQVQTFNPQANLTYADIEANELTVNNIRLWDKRPLLETNRQLQRIRLYYEFPDADLDRYTLRTEDGSPELRQVLIAARELDYNSVPSEAQTWVNEHLIYTHGYGFTVSPVNVAGEGGLPDYFIRGIEQIPSSPQIRESIPIGSPRIYYGELTNTYVMTQTQVRELDYPSGSDNVYNSYDGFGGINIGHWWQRLLYAKHLRDWRMIFTDNFTPDTRLLFRRNIKQRVQSIAPFLRFDNDPYLVVADVGSQQIRRDRPQTQTAQLPEPNYLYWIIDAYTTSDRYPYSDPLSNDFNYIRNSVKVVIDAYNGDVWFYVADPEDPIIQTWSRIFPGMLRSFNEMPSTLQTHIRYPADFYLAQSEQLMVYHMTDPQVFYNREDQWRAPNEIYGGEELRVEPYYLVLDIPSTPYAEFILLRPFTPVQRNNLVAWLAARSDGAQYGNMLLYLFSKQELVFGTEQIEARINQDPVISQQISLWNRRGSSAIQGNLLVIPIEESLLYVEPIYLQAEQNQLPILARVIVAYEDRIVMAETLEQALQAIFRPAEETQAPAIIRSLEQDAVPPLE